MEKSLRFWLLLTALLLQIGGGGYAAFARADAPPASITVTATAMDTEMASELRDGIRTEAQDAAAIMRSTVAADLDARLLAAQHESRRLAGRNEGERG